MIRRDDAARKERRAKRLAKARNLWGTPSRTVVRKQLWDLISLLVRRRDRGLCRICGNRLIQVAYHLVPAQRGDSIRYDLDGIVGACAPCNYAEFRNRSLYRDKHIRIFGKELIERLEAKAREAVHYSTADLVALRDAIKTKLETMGGLK